MFFIFTNNISSRIVLLSTPYHSYIPLPGINFDNNTQSQSVIAQSDLFEQFVHQSSSSGSSSCFLFVASLIDLATIIEQTKRKQRSNQNEISKRKLMILAFQVWFGVCARLMYHCYLKTFACFDTKNAKPCPIYLLMKKKTFSRYYFLLPKKKYPLSGRLAAILSNVSMEFSLSVNNKRYSGYLFIYFFYFGPVSIPTIEWNHYRHHHQQQQQKITT